MLCSFMHNFCLTKKCRRGIESQKRLHTGTALDAPYAFCPVSADTNLLIDPDLPGLIPLILEDSVNPVAEDRLANNGNPGYVLQR